MYIPAGLGELSETAGGLCSVLEILYVIYWLYILSNWVAGVSNSIFRFIERKIYWQESTTNMTQRLVYWYYLLTYLLTYSNHKSRNICYRRGSQHISSTTIKTIKNQCCDLEANRSLTLWAEFQSAQMSKITNDGLTRSGKDVL